MIQIFLVNITLRVLSIASLIDCTKKLLVHFDWQPIIATVLKKCCLNFFLAEGCFLSFPKLILKLWKWSARFE